MLKNLSINPDQSSRPLRASIIVSFFAMITLLLTATAAAQSVSVDTEETASSSVADAQDAKTRLSTLEKRRAEMRANLRARREKIRSLRSNLRSARSARRTPAARRRESGNAAASFNTPTKQPAASRAALRAARREAREIRRNLRAVRRDLRTTRKELRAAATAPTPAPAPAAVAPAAVLTKPEPAPVPVIPSVTSLHPDVRIDNLPASGDTVSSFGHTIFGAVKDFARFKTVEATIDGSRTMTASVGDQRGQFAVRIFERDFEGDSRAIVKLRGVDAEGETSEVSTIDLRATDDSDGLREALKRVSFGGSPELYEHVQKIGFEKYVEEQLALEGDTRVRDKFGFTDYLDYNEVWSRVKNHKWHSDSVYPFSITLNNYGNAVFNGNQLQQVMTHFWANHFNVNLKGQKRFDVNAPEYWNGFRRHAFDNFETILFHSAKSPAMMIYLDNEHNNKDFVNENYARELMELHTVGVDGGYDDEDLIEVARVLTGWNVKEHGVIDRTDYNGRWMKIRTFNFDPDIHDTDDKHIKFLNMTIKGRTGAAGIQEGEQLIKTLAQHPKTRAFVCSKLVEMLVSDTPPKRYVENCAEAWKSTRGEIKPILRSILLDPDYLEDQSVSRVKTKTPHEYMVGLTRFLDIQRKENQGISSNDSRHFNRNIAKTGYDMYRYPVPTGMDEVSSTWNEVGSLAARLKWGTQIVYEARRQYYMTSGTYYRARKNGFETPEELAAYLLDIGTGERFTESDYESVLKNLVDDKGRFYYNEDNYWNEKKERRHFFKAMAIIANSPSFQIQ